MSTSTFFEKFADIQSRLVVQKGNFNEFGKYRYRSCEDILGALKPLLREHALFVRVEDDLVLIGDRHYIKSTATISDGTTHLSSSAFAREPKDKKGMDDSQITGSTSSYSRKTALGGLLGIDDGKDSDGDEPKDSEPENKTGSRFQGSSVKPADFIAPDGKFKGKKLSDIPRKELTDYCVELTEKNKETGMTGDLKKFVDTAREYLRTLPKTK